MSINQSRLAYDDCYAIMDHALKTKNGVRFSEETEGKATHLVNRLNYARLLSRQLSMEIHEEDEPQYGVTEYDRLFIRRPKLVDGKWWIYIERHGTVDVNRLEEL